MVPEDKRYSNGKMEIIKSHHPSNPAGKLKIVLKLKRPPEPEVITEPNHDLDDYVIANGTDKLLYALLHGA